MGALLNCRVAAWLMLVVLAATPATAEAGAMGVLVPSYFYPGSGGPGGVGDGWAAMTAAAGQIPLTAILNPNSGPLPGPADPNYVSAMTNLENAGGKVVAYIYTDYGVTPIATVEADVSTYITQYGSLINGFFLDGMSNSATELGYYDSLYAHIKSLNPAYQVIGNPGTTTIAAYLAPATKAADVLLTLEHNDTATPYSTTPPPSWVYGYPSSDFANALYNQPTVAGMQADVNTALAYNVGSIFVTDQTIPNPYGQLPSYWDQEVAAIKAADTTPEPATLVLWSLAGVAAALFRTGRRRLRADFV